ncbi:MAG TPA: PD-(D/E)XK motif protein, partial [Nitrospira sp.]|nr:PD-(D/E)XK motif protein [Nitrospira sp.]
MPWAELVPPLEPDALSAVRLAGLPTSVSAYAAIDFDGRRHFLVALEKDVDELNEATTRGLRVSTREWIVSGTGGIYVDLACTDVSLYDTFDAVVLQVAENVARYPRDPRRAVTDALARWRRFWTLEANLSREAQTGLIGEMWFLSRWMRPLTAAKFASWFGPDASRHDFQTVQLSVEVKTTASRTGPLIHRIGSLEQLADPASGAFYLFSLRIADDPIASNTLATLVDGLSK